MAKKKSSKPPPKKESAKLDTVFMCPICNSHRTVYCTLNYGEGKGTLQCAHCKEAYVSTNVNHLTDPIDVYTEWIDLCEEANE